jgi:hypothetical protein
MPDIARYWEQIRAMEAELPEFPWLAGPRGGIAQVRRPTAARLLHRGSHRLATDTEIEAHRQMEAETRARADREAMRRRGVTVVAVGRPERPRSKKS